jgi:hypothetical protein
MAGRYLSWIVCGLFIAGLLICSGYAANEPGEQRVKVNEQMVAAAKETLKATQAVHNVGHVSSTPLGLTIAGSEAVRRGVTGQVS